MANSLLQLEFNKEAVATDIVSFDIRSKLSNKVLTIVLSWTNKDPRIQKYTVPVTPDFVSPVPGYGTASSYAAYLRTDYGESLFTANFSFIYVKPTVIVQLNTPDFIFENTYLNNNLLDFTVQNNLAPIYELLSYSFTEADLENDRCSKFNLTIETSTLTKRIVYNNIELLNNNLDNPFTLVLNRGVISNLSIENEEGTVLKFPAVGKNLKAPLLSDPNININVLQLLSSATVKIEVGGDEVSSNLFELDLDYSLDNVNWQKDNVFSNQIPGSYTIYIKDQLGCKKSKNFEITDTSTRQPFLFLSKANAINFKEHEDWDNCSIYKNSVNTLACERLVGLNYSLPNLFQTCDSTTIQFKSNYFDIDATLRKEDGQEFPLIINKMTSNLDRFQSMDCIIYKYSDSKAGVYFASGSVYEEGGFIIGEYSLEGNLPDMAKIGNFIEINGIGIFDIKDVIFDDNISKKAMIIDYEYNSTPATFVVKSIFDLLNYDVYEFVIDWSVYGEGVYDLLLSNKDTQGNEALLQSENLDVRKIQEGTLAIVYYNKNNRDIFYKYGIKHLIRICYDYIEAGIKDESEISEGDLITSLNSSSIHEKDEIMFIDLTDEVMRKLAIALSCENLFINGVGYVKDGSLEVTPLKNTNLHDLKVSLIKTNINYNNNKQGKVGVDYDYIDINIPAFITTGEGFINS